MFSTSTDCKRTETKTNLPDSSVAVEACAEDEEALRDDSRALALAVALPMASPTEEATSEISAPIDDVMLAKVSSSVREERASLKLAVASEAADEMLASIEAVSSSVKAAKDVRQQLPKFIACAMGLAHLGQRPTLG